MNYLNEVNERFPVRRSEREKKEFREYVMEVIQKQGKIAEVETVGKRHNNVVIGDIRNAKVIFTAHYDTPATSLFPNLMMPRNPVLCYLYHFSYPFLLAMLSLLAAAIIKAVFSLSFPVYMSIYVVLYLLVFFICTRAFTNKHNKNDNTSGVAAVLSLVEKNKNDSVAFILFDNEERGLLGSRAFNKKHKNDILSVPVLNLDCVGFGKNILVIAKKEAETLPLYSMLQSILCSDGDYNVEYFPAKGSIGNSDHKSFKCGIGIMSCKRARAIGYYTSRIHTGRDTEANEANIEFLSDRLSLFTENL